MCALGCIWLQPAVKMEVSQVARATAAVALWQPARGDQEGQPPGIHSVAAPLWSGVSGALEEDYVMALWLRFSRQRARALYVDFLHYIVSGAPVDLYAATTALVKSSGCVGCCHSGVPHLQKTCFVGSELSKMYSTWCRSSWASSRSWSCTAPRLGGEAPPCAGVSVAHCYLTVHMVLLAKLMHICRQLMQPKQAWPGVCGQDEPIPVQHILQ